LSANHLAPGTSCVGSRVVNAQHQAAVAESRWSATSTTAGSTSTSAGITGVSTTSARRGSASSTAPRLSASRMSAFATMSGPSEGRDASGAARRAAVVSAVPHATVAAAQHEGQDGRAGLSGLQGDAAAHEAHRPHRAASGRPGVVLREVESSGFMRHLSLAENESRATGTMSFAMKISIASIAINLATIAFQVWVARRWM